MQFQTNVILTQEDADWLDEQILAFRKHNRKSLNRSALLRALLHAARAVELNVSRCPSQEHIAESVADLLRRGGTQLQDELRNQTRAHSR